MITKVNREGFLHSLESVEAGLASRETVEQSSCFIFKKGRVYTFDDEVSCSGKIALNGEFTGAVKAEKLLNLLRKLKAEEIQLETSDTELLVKGKGAQKSGILMEREITLPISAVDKPKEWFPLHREFTEAINIVQHCAGKKDDFQFYRTCVHLHPKWVEACDNFQLCRWKMKTGIKEPILVRQSSIKHVTSLGMMEFSETQSWIHFRNPNGVVLSCRRYIDEFPDLNEVLKTIGVPITLPKGLVEAADIAKDFASENADNKQISIELLPGKVRVKGQGVSGWFSDAKKINYNGPRIKFLIAPDLLINLVKKHNDCEVSANSLRVVSDAYIYMSWLYKPEEEPKSEEVEVSER